MAIAATPLLVAAAALGALEVRLEELVAPVVIGGVVALGVELAFAIEAGLAANRAAEALAPRLEALRRDPPES